MPKEPGEPDDLIISDDEAKEEKEIDIESATTEELKSRLEELKAEISLFEDSNSEMTRARAEAAEDKKRDIGMELERRKEQGEK